MSTWSPTLSSSSDLAELETTCPRELVLDDAYPAGAHRGRDRAYRVHGLGEPEH